jgi:hypothetical protein
MGHALSTTNKLHDFELRPCFDPSHAPVCLADNIAVQLDSDARSIDIKPSQQLEYSESGGWPPGFAVHHNFNEICFRRLKGIRLTLRHAPHYIRE